MKKSYLLIAIIFLTFSLPYFANCTMQVPENSLNKSKNTETVTFVFPQWPPNDEVAQQYPVLKHWFVQVEGAEISKEFYTSENNITLNIAKNIPCSVTASPITYIPAPETENKVTTTSNTSSFFKPAGTIYPYYINSTATQNLTWEEGFTATLMQTIYKSRLETGISSEHIQNFQKSFNWKKCNDYILSKTQDLAKGFFNPWQIDRQNLLENLCYANFSATYLTPKNVIQIPLEDLTLSDCNSILSSYIPENQNIWNNKVLTIQKNKTEVYMCNQIYQAQINCSSAKKVSVAFTYLPIFY